MTDTQATQHDDGWTQLRYRDLADHAEALREVQKAMGQVALFLARQEHPTEQCLIEETLLALGNAAFAVDGVAMDLEGMTPEDDARRNEYSKAAGEFYDQASATIAALDSEDTQ